MNRALASVVLGALRHFPTDSLRWRMLPWGLRTCEQVFASPLDKSFRTRHGFALNLDLSDWLGRHIYVTGEYEAATTRVFQSRLKPGACVLDVGANAGYFSCLSASLVGPGGRVLSVEPIPRLNQRVRRNANLNQFRWIQTFDVALSNASAVSRFHVGPVNHMGVSSLREIVSSSETFDVQVVRGDDLFAGIERLDFIKIDVEGAECHVLEGAVGLLQRFTPDLVIEVTPPFLAAMGRTAADIEALLRPLGYRFFVIENDGLRELPGLNDPALSQFNAFLTTDPDARA